MLLRKLQEWNSDIGWQRGEVNLEVEAIIAWSQTTAVGIDVAHRLILKSVVANNIIVQQR